MATSSSDGGCGSATEEAFKPCSGLERQQLLKSHPVWRWVDRGQKKAGSSHGAWRMRCRLCNKAFVGALPRAVNHFIQKSDSARCNVSGHQHGEILLALKNHGVTIPLFLQHPMREHMLSEGIPDEAGGGGLVGNSSGGVGCSVDAPSTSPDSSGLDGHSTDVAFQQRSGKGAAMIDEVRPEIAAFMREGRAAGGRPPIPPAASGASDTGKTPVKQRKIDEYCVDELQKAMDRAWADFFYENGIPFNVARSKSFKLLHLQYLAAIRARKIVTQAQYNALRGSLLDDAYERVRALVKECESSWDTTGVTLMTDGTTTTSNRPVINFLAGGDKGAVMLKTVDMEGKEKTAAALADMWVGVIREIGPHRVNAICTDSAQANISAVKTYLSTHSDPEIRRIPWVPCACHVSNLLLQDLAKEPWIAEIIVQGRDITLFIKRHQRPSAMMGSIEGSAKLVAPGDTRFATYYLMLHKLRAQKRVLEELVGQKAWDDAPWTSKLENSARRCKELVRDGEWWGRVDDVLRIMEPVYDLLRAMDSDGRMGSQVWEMGVVLESRMSKVQIPEDSRESIMEKVKARVKMMALPVHAAAFLLHPKHRSDAWVLHSNSEVVTNALAYFTEVYGKGTKEYLECWDSFQSFHQKEMEDWGGENGELALKTRRMTPAAWWSSYGGKHKLLQRIALHVLSMWTTASPCERNWSTQDFVHTKRRNRLSPERLQKLVYIHWNSKFLELQGKRLGWVNTWLLDMETPEDEPCELGVLSVGEFDPQYVANRAANWSKSSRGRRSQATNVRVCGVLENEEDDREWLFTATYSPPELQCASGLSHAAKFRRIREGLEREEEEEEEEEEEDEGASLVRRSTWRSGRTPPLAMVDDIDMDAPSPVTPSRRLPFGVEGRRPVGGVGAGGDAVHGAHNEGDCVNKVPSVGAGGDSTSRGIFPSMIDQVYPQREFALPPSLSPFGPQEETPERGHQCNLEGERIVYERRGRTTGREAGMEGMPSQGEGGLGVSEEVGDRPLEMQAEEPPSMKKWRGRIQKALKNFRTDSKEKMLKMQEGGQGGGKKKDDEMLRKRKKISSKTSTRDLGSGGRAQVVNRRSPPKLDESKVRKTKSLAGRKKGSKNKNDERLDRAVKKRRVRFADPGIEPMDVEGSHAARSHRRTELQDRPAATKGRKRRRTVEIDDDDTSSDEAHGPSHSASSSEEPWKEDDTSSESTDSSSPSYSSTSESEQPSDSNTGEGERERESD